MKDWERFVVDHGWRAPGHHLAFVVGQPLDAVLRLREKGVCTRLPKPRTFLELFSLWHGRPPVDQDWPTPKRIYSGAYEWLAPELALVASLVGRIEKKAIATVLTRRLRKLTEDPTAERTPNGVQLVINRMGMLATDVVGGITARAAGAELGSYHSVIQAIEAKKLRARRIGKYYVIPYDAWQEWKSKRVAVPKGFVPLIRLMGPLGIRSDSKLPEFAAAGYIPTAVRCNPAGRDVRTTRFGTWYIDPKVARKMVRDRRAGRPMPWHGKPLRDNLKKTFGLWTDRKHPDACRTCAQIWGSKGAPTTFEDYLLRYPPLEHGAKRHLTRKWSPGMLVSEVARKSGRDVVTVRRAIANGALIATRMQHWYVSKTDFTRWKTRGCPTGDTGHSWAAIETVVKAYAFKLSEIETFIAEGKLKSKIGTNGPQRGVRYVSRVQCAQLRESMGYSEAEAARRVGVSVSKIRTLLHGVNWRGATGIPLVTVQACAKRLDSREGYSFEEAAAKLGKSVEWVEARKLDGTIRVARTKWDRRRTYITEPMFQRLVRAKRRPAKKKPLGPDWLLSSRAAAEAGISAATLDKWAVAGEVERRASPAGWRYHRKAVRARARRYWKTQRFQRAVPPVWMAPRNSSQEIRP